MFSPVLWEAYGRFFAEYGEPVREAARLWPMTAYAATKAAAETPFLGCARKTSYIISMRYFFAAPAADGLRAMRRQLLKSRCTIILISYNTSEI